MPHLAEPLPTGKHDIVFFALFKQVPASLNHLCLSLGGETAAGETAAGDEDWNLLSSIQFVVGHGHK